MIPLVLTLMLGFSTTLFVVYNHLFHLYGSLIGSLRMAAVILLGGHHLLLVRIVINFCCCMCCNIQLAGWHQQRQSAG